MSNSRTRMSLVPKPVLIIFLALLAAAPLFGSDGSLEINQACVAAGCFPGDSPGFPVQIVENGSYRLTSNLSVPDENTTAILSTAENVTLDLGGFVIAGVTSCSGNPTVCAPLGTGRGVELGINVQSVLRNGTIRRMGSSGVLMAGLAEGIVAENNGGTGITNDGITRDSIIRFNGGTGLSCGSGMAHGNLVTRNAGTGISGSGGAMIRGNRVRLNGGLNDDPGIFSVDGFVWQNDIQFNRGPGLQANGTTVYGNNRLQSNNLAAGPTAANQVIGGTQLGPNSCQSTACP